MNKTKLKFNLNLKFHNKQTNHKYRKYKMIIKNN